jgi:adenylate kinase
VKIVLLGPPGSGKGTQALRLMKAHGLASLSTGDMLRAAARAGTSVGRKAEAIMKRGELVPDEVVVAIIGERLAGADCAQGFILDGFPRTKAQAAALDGMLAKAGQRLTKVIEFKVNEAALVDRIGGRFNCVKCDAAYHETNNRPQREGVCDVCGGTKFSRRPDDNAEAIKVRLDAYRRQTAPLLPYYRNQGLLTVVDAMAEIDTVTKEIEGALAA